MSQARTRARRMVVQAIYQWQMTGQDAGEIDAQFENNHDMNHVDVEYFRELIREIPLHVHELDDQYLEILDRRVEDLDPVEHAVLLLGTYELEFRKDIPFRVVINEGVELAKMFGAEEGHKYINGILDKVAFKLRSDEVNAARAKTGKGKRGG